MRVAELLTELANLGVRIETRGDRLRVTPMSAVRPALAERIKAHKDELLAELRSPGIPITSSAFLCPFCSVAGLLEREHGLWCDGCNRIAWIDGPDGGIVRLDHKDDRVSFADTLDESAESIEQDEFYWSQMKEEDYEYATAKRPKPDPCVWCGGLVTHSDLCTEQRKSWIPKLGFGKHVGKRVDEVPLDYLWWAWGKGVIRDVDVKAAVRELLGIPKVPGDDDANDL